jgi:hypothetical protein
MFGIGGGGQLRLSGRQRVLHGGMLMKVGTHAVSFPETNLAYGEFLVAAAE